MRRMKLHKSNHQIMKPATKIHLIMKKLVLVLNSIWHLDSQLRAHLKRDVNVENRDLAHDQGL